MTDPRQLVEWGHELAESLRRSSRQDARTVQALVDALGTALDAQDYLRFELQGLENVRVKDNEYLIAERDAARAETERMRGALAAYPLGVALRGA